MVIYKRFLAVSFVPLVKYDLLILLIWTIQKSAVSSMIWRQILGVADTLWRK